MSDYPIAVFDSGIGGLTVLQALQKKLPDESFLYFGDTAHVPYGDKSRHLVQEYTLKNARFLSDQGIKLLVIACNTASAFALEIVANTLPVPVIGVIQPGVEAVVEATKSKRIGVIGTKGTIRSGLYQKLIQEAIPEANIFAKECPIFVPLIEEGYVSHPGAKMLIVDSILPLLEQEIDTLLLGCTHYPMLKHLLQETLGSQVTIVDSATACSHSVNNLLSHFEKPTKTPTLEFFVTDESEAFLRHLNTFIGKGPIPHQITEVTHP